MAAACSTTSSSVALPSRRPSVKANPELVVASALNPSAASTRAEPASHGFGSTNASPAWRSRKSAAFCSCLLLVTLHHLAPPELGGLRILAGFAQGSALAEQVPVLVERDLQLSQALSIAVAGVPGRFPFPQLPLLLDELLDRCVDLSFVLHLQPPF